MFSYLFMKILESRPRSYDRNMDKASRGRVKQIKEAVTKALAGAARVLEIGCGTGELAAMLIARGSVVQGFDRNAGMLEQAKKRIQRDHLEDKLTVNHMGVDGMDCYSDRSFDAVVSTLVFSELSADERRYALNQSARILKPDGRMVIADEVIPEKVLSRLLHTIIRLPMMIGTYIIARTITAPIDDLAGEMEKAGFIIEKEMRSHGDSFAIVSGRIGKDG